MFKLIKDGLLFGKIVPEKNITFDYEQDMVAVQHHHYNLPVTK